MNRMALTAAAILVATGSAFAGSDHYGSGDANQPVPSMPGVDHAVTGAVKTTNTTGQKPSDAKMNTITEWPESGQGIWGN